MLNHHVPVLNAINHVPIVCPCSDATMTSPSPHTSSSHLLPIAKSDVTLCIWMPQRARACNHGSGGCRAIINMREGCAIALHDCWWRWGHWLNYQPSINSYTKLLKALILLAKEYREVYGLSSCRIICLWVWLFTLILSKWFNYWLEPALFTIH